jgi:hypothetical protein
MYEKKFLVSKKAKKSPLEAIFSPCTAILPPSMARFSPRKARFPPGKDFDMSGEASILLRMKKKMVPGKLFHHRYHVFYQKLNGKSNRID